MKQAALTGVAILALGSSAVAWAQGAAKPEKIEPVAVVGCLKEATPDVWMLVNASDPVPSTANAPQAKELAALPRGGKNEFQLIGVSIFNLPSHKDQSVAVKGLLIKATPTNRLNITSVTTVAKGCAG